MTIQNLLIAGFLLINFTLIQCNDTESTMLPTGTSEVITSAASSYSLVSTEATSLTTLFSSTYVTSSVTQLSSMSITSSNVPTSGTPTTTQPRSKIQSNFSNKIMFECLDVTLDLIYRFDISSSQPLELGNFTNDTVLNSVQAMVGQILLQNLRSYSSGID